MAVWEDTFGGYQTEGLEIEVQATHTLFYGLLERGGEFGQIVHDRRHIGQRELPNLSQYPYALLHVPQIQRIVESAHYVPPFMRDHQHLLKFVPIPGQSVEKRESLIRLLTLETNLGYLLIALSHGLLP
jgi:hypothetical protein